MWLKQEGIYYFAFVFENYKPTRPLIISVKQLPVERGVFVECTTSRIDIG
jgi:hypothetical protein